MAVKSGQIEVARMLIENGSDIDSVCCKKNIAELINEIMPGLDPASIVRLRDSPAKDSDKPINRMAKLIEEAALIKERSNPARLGYFSEFRVLLLKSDPREMVILLSFAANLYAFLVPICANTTVTNLFCHDDMHGWDLNIKSEQHQHSQKVLFVVPDTNSVPGWVSPAESCRRKTR